MKDNLSGNDSVGFFTTKLKNNVNFDFSIASTFLNTVVTNKKSLKDNLVNSDISWKNIHNKIISNLFFN